MSAQTETAVAEAYSPLIRAHRALQTHLDREAEHKRQAEGMLQAARQLTTEIGALGEAYESAWKPLIDAVIAHYREERDLAVAEVQKSLQALARPLARLWAAEWMQETLLPDYVLGEDPLPEEVWGGAQMVAALVEAVPTPLLPEGFHDAMDVEAKRSANKMIAAVLDRIPDSDRHLMARFLGGPAGLHPGPQVLPIK